MNTTSSKSLRCWHRNTMAPPKLPSTTVTPIDSTEHAPKISSLPGKRWKKHLEKWWKMALGLEIHHGCFSFNQSCQVLTRHDSHGETRPSTRCYKTGRPDLTKRSGWMLMSPDLPKEGPDFSGLHDTMIQLDMLYTVYSHMTSHISCWFILIHVDSCSIHSNTGLRGMDLGAQSRAVDLEVTLLWPQLHCIHSSLCHHLTVQFTAPLIILLNMMYIILQGAGLSRLLNA